MKLSSPKIKKLFIFSQKKIFLIFQEPEAFQKNSYISGGSSPRTKNKKILIFLASSLKSYISGGNSKVLKINLYILHHNIFHKND